MAGNSKSKRKPGKVPSVAELMTKARAARVARYATINGGIHKRNGLPLGHPSNMSKVAKTFKPIEDMLSEQLKFGSLMHDQDGIAVMRIEDEQTWTPITHGLLELCHAIDVASRALIWPAQPPGLRAFALKLATSGKLSDDDVFDARETVAWMRRQVGTITPQRWQDLLDEADATERRQLEQEAACL